MKVQLSGRSSCLDGPVVWMVQLSGSSSCLDGPVVWTVQLFVLVCSFQLPVSAPGGITAQFPVVLLTCILFSQHVKTLVNSVHLINLLRVSWNLLSIIN